MADLSHLIADRVRAALADYKSTATGRITATNPGPPPTATIGGDTYRYLAGYTPVVGDFVVYLRSDRLILGPRA